MKLAELEAVFFRYDVRIESYSVMDGDPATWNLRGQPTKKMIGPRTYMVPVDSLAAAQALDFLCPKCFAANGHSNVGVHHVEVTIAGRGVPDELGTHNKAGQPVRWNAHGTSFDDLSLTPSILIEDGCGWHGFVTHGNAA